MPPPKDFPRRSARNAPRAGARSPKEFANPHKNFPRNLQEISRGLGQYLPGTSQIPKELPEELAETPQTICMTCPKVPQGSRTRMPAGLGQCSPGIKHIALANPQGICPQDLGRTPKGSANLDFARAIAQKCRQQVTKIS